MTERLTPEAEQVIDKIQKLLNLAAKNPNEAEAASAQAKAAELMLKHNLDVGTVEREGGGSGKRELANIEGGFYQWQRDLWGAVASLNFCRYWSQRFIVHVKGARRKYADGTTYKADIDVYRRRHALIGRTVNVRATEVMATYLERAVARAVEERFPGRPFAEGSGSYREGIAYKLAQRLRARRREIVAKEQADADRAARAGVSTATALTVTSYAQSEEDANTDFRFGEGTAAEWRAQRAAQAEAARAEREAYTKWAAENPEEARKKEETERKKEERRARTSSRERFGGVKDDGMFWAGADAGEKISLDPQVDGGTASPRRIGRR